MKVVRRILVVFILLAVLLVGAVFFIGKYYGDEVKNLVVTNLNKSLKTEVQVKHIDFSVWENFPRASVVFSDVLIYAVDSKNDTLLAAKKLSAQFNLIDLYHKKYKLIGLGIEDGICQMLTDSEGKPNYIFWDESDSSSSSFSINLQKVDIDNMEFFYLDYSTNIAIGFLINQLDLKGNFADAVFELDFNGDLQHTNIKVDQTIILEERSVQLDVKGNVDQNEEALNFNDTEVEIDKMNIGVSGQLLYGKASSIDFQLNSGNTDLKKAIALLPYSLQKKLSRFNIKGGASFNGNITGPINSYVAPAYSFDFTVSDGLLKDKESDLSFSKINLQGKIDNGTKKTLESTRLTLTSFSTKLKNSRLKGQVTLENFKKPSYAFKGNLGFELEEAVSFLQLTDILQPQGSISADIEMSGTMASINSYDLRDWKKATVNGKVTTSELGLKYKGHPQIISGANGNFTFNNNSVNVEELSVRVDENLLNIEGKFNNLIGYFIDESEPLFVDAKLSSKQINLADFLASEESSTESNYPYQLQISPRITFYLETKISQLDFNQFQLKNLEGAIVVKNSRIDARGISFDSQEGIFRGDLFVREQENYLTIAASAQLRKIDIQKTFKSFNNFGQNTLRSEHISGITNAEVSFSSNWSKNLEVDLNSITADILFNIDEGRLTNFKPLESLSTFVELEELKDVKFQQLQNHILIKNGTITIPRFNIFSSALNLSLAGTHTFENNIDYKITLLLSEILGRKAKKSKSYRNASSEFGYVEDDGLGKTKLFLKMTGSVENPKIGYDSKELKNNLQNKFSKEKSTFKNLMKDEFGLFKNDTSLKPSPKIKRKQSPFQVELDSSYTKQKEKSNNSENEQDKAPEKNEKANKSKFGKFLDKIAKPNEDEFVEPEEN